MNPIRIIALLSALLLAPPCVAANGPMKSLFQIGIDQSLARSTQPDGLCSPAIVPQAVAGRISRLLSAINATGLQDELGHSPAYYAVMADDPAQLQRLLELGYGTQDVHGPLLDAAAFWNSVKTARLLLERGGNPNLPNDAGSTPLLVAVSEGGPDVALLLLAHGAQVSVRDLHYAIICRSQRNVDLLLRSGAKIDAHARQLAKKFGMELPPAAPD